MTWVYSQKKGNLKHNGVTISTGYSGHGEGKNNPKLETKKNVGPIPRGLYDIGLSYDHASKGPTTMGLTPVGHNACGRSDFLIHGDSIKYPGCASEGCIILNRDTRNKISDSKDKRLEVIE